MSDMATSPGARIAAALRRAGIGAGGSAVVAFSGGPDSLGLLAILAAFPSRPDLLAVHVDHGLVPTSGEAARHAREAAAALGVACSVVAVRPEGRGGIEAAARRARYRALAEQAAGRPVLTAHTADDQAETLLLRLSRGTGLAGLAGVRARAVIEGAHVVRPALAVRRAELAAVAAGSGIAPLSDPMNADARFARTRVRGSVLPALEAALPGAVAGLARAAELLGADEAHFARQAGRALLRLSLPSGIDSVRLLRLPAAVRGRVVRQLVLGAGGRTPDLRHVKAVLHAARVEGEAHLPGGVLARCRAGVLWVGKGPTGQAARARAGGRD